MLTANDQLAAVSNHADLVVQLSRPPNRDLIPTALSKCVDAKGVEACLGIDPSERILHDTFSGVFGSFANSYLQHEIVSAIESLFLEIPKTELSFTKRESGANSVYYDPVILPSSAWSQLRLALLHYAAAHPRESLWADRIVPLLHSLVSKFQHQIQITIDNPKVRRMVWERMVQVYGLCQNLNRPGPLTSFLDGWQQFHSPTSLRQNAEDGERLDFLYQEETAATNPFVLLAAMNLTGTISDSSVCTHTVRSLFQKALDSGLQVLIREAVKYGASACIILDERFGGRCEMV